MDRRNGGSGLTLTNTTADDYNSKVLSERGAAPANRSNVSCARSLPAAGWRASLCFL